MSSYKLSNKARLDIEAIWDDTVQRWSLNQAIKYDTLLEKALTLIAENPFIGRVHNDLLNNCRVLTFQRHYIFYSISEDGEVLIDRILHQHMNVDIHLFDE